MRGGGVVATRSWIKLPVRDEYEDDQDVHKAPHGRHGHNDRDDVDRARADHQKLPSIQDVAEHFQASRYNKYVC